MNLEVPQMAQFINRLAEQGFSFPDDCRTVDEVFERVKQFKGGEHHAS